MPTDTAGGSLCQCRNNSLFYLGLGLSLYVPNFALTFLFHRPVISIVFGICSVVSILLAMNCAFKKCSCAVKILRKTSRDVSPRSKWAFLITLVVVSIGWISMALYGPTKMICIVVMISCMGLVGLKLIAVSVGNSRKLKASARSN